MISFIEKNPSNSDFSASFEGMIKTKFMFPNFGGKTHTQILESTCRVIEIRDNIVPTIIKENNYVKDGQPQKIRLFHLGTELQEGKTIQDYNKTPNNEGDPEVVIHVFISQQQQKPLSAPTIANPVKREQRTEQRTEDNVCTCNMF